MLIKWFIKPGFRIALALACLLLLMAGALVWWVATGPRPVPSYVSARIEDALTRALPGINVHGGDAVIRWDGLEKGLGLFVRNVRLSDGLERELASLPEVRVRLDTLNLLLGSVILSDVHLNAPEFRLFAPEEPLPPPPWREKANQTGQYRRALAVMFAAIRANGGELPIGRVRVKNARFIAEGGVEEPWELPEASLGFSRTGGLLSFEADIRGLFSEKLAALRLEGTLDSDRRLKIHAVGDNLPSLIFGEAMQEYPWLRSLPLLFGGSADIAMRPDGAPETAEFSLDGKPPETLQLPDTVLNASGKLAWKKSASPSVTLKASLKSLPMDKLALFWPEEFAGPVREWVTGRFSGGFYDSAALELSLSPEDVARGTVRKDALKSEIAFRDAKILYHDGLPPIEGASGKAAFDGDSMEMTVGNARAGGMVAPETQVKITGIGGDAMLDVTGILVGAIGDMTPFITLKSDAMAMEKALALRSSLSGDAKAAFGLRLPIKNSLTREEIEVQVSADLSEVAIARALGENDISASSMTLKIDKNALTLQGSGSIGDYPAENMECAFHFAADKKGAAECGANLFIHPERFSNPETDDVLAGSMRIAAAISGSSGKTLISGKADLSRMDIGSGTAGWRKPEGEEAALAFEAEYKEGAVRVPSFLFTAKDAVIKGSVEWSVAGSNWRLDQIDFGPNRLQLTLAGDGQKHYRAGLSGQYFDMGPFIGRLPQWLAQTFDFAVTVKGTVARVKLANGVEMNNASVSLYCAEEICPHTGFRGAFAEGGNLAVDFGDEKMTGPGAVRPFSIRTDNAGAFLLGANMVKTVSGGALEISAESPLGSGELRNGKIIIKDFRVEKAPVLAKLLTLGSFTGIVELLNGRGISFDKLKGEFSFKDSRLALAQIKMSGSSLGLTADGSVDLAKPEVDVDGALIPAYTLNSILGNVPLVGDILIGKEGEGVIATRYSMSGPLEDPSVTVNPFSMLTPGFLRKIWEGGKE